MEGIKLIMTNEQENILQRIALHFGLKSTEVRHDEEDYDNEFEITFDSGKNWYLLEVVSKEIAIRNCQDFISDGSEVEFSTHQIEYYTQLIGTTLYFRWF